MIIIPAIDILNGECVRLFKGDYAQSIVYDNDPAVVAGNFEKAGAVRIHIVDLDAAKGEGKNNRKQIKRIRDAVNCRLEAGGGIRKERDVEELLSIGVDRLIIGTVFVRDPEKVTEWIEKYGKVFIAGIDAFNGQVKIAGWQEGTAIIDTELAKLAKSIGVNSIIYTNIARDGALEGPDIERTAAIGRESKLPVILSGGISCEKDIEAIVKGNFSGITGIITGKAVYEGKINLETVIKKYQEPDISRGEW